MIIICGVVVDVGLLLQQNGTTVYKVRILQVTVFTTNTN